MPCTGLALGSSTGLITDFASIDVTLAIQGVLQGPSGASVDILYDINTPAIVQAVLYPASDAPPAEGDFPGDGAPYLALGTLGLAPSGTATLALPAELSGDFRIGFRYGPVIVEGPIFAVDTTGLAPTPVALFGFGSGGGSATDGGDTLIVSGASVARDGRYDISDVGTEPTYVRPPAVSVEETFIRIHQGLAIDRDATATVSCQVRILSDGVEVSVLPLPFTVDAFADYVPQPADPVGARITVEFALTSSTGQTSVLTLVAVDPVVSTLVGTVSNVVPSGGDLTFDLSGAGAANGSYVFTAAEQAAGAKWLLPPTVTEGPADTFTAQNDGVFVYVATDAGGGTLAAPTVVVSWTRGGTEIASGNSYTLTPEDGAQQVDCVATLYTATGGAVEVVTEVQAEAVYVPQVVTINAHVTADTSAVAPSDHLAFLSWFKVTEHSGFRFMFDNNQRETQFRNGELKGVMQLGDGSGSGSSTVDTTAPIGAQVFVAVIGSPGGNFQSYMSIDGGPLIAGPLKPQPANTTFTCQAAAFSLYSRYSGTQGVVADYARHVVAIPRASFDIEAPGMIDKLRVAGTGLPTAPALNAVEWDTLLIDDRGTATERAAGTHFGTLGDLTVVSGTHAQVSP
ncbi:hypothetical protein [Jannaschia sp. 2305UL9-9]|uniref:hypothetical protein n=1 Tax=Jannaschia sp. 2305UL9-9 TaxID=3121638 RepID=UPI0035299FE3